MLVYFASHKEHSTIPCGSVVTTSLKDAAIIAKLKCDEHGVDVRNAVIYKSSVEQWRLRNPMCMNGADFYSVDFAPISDTLTYNDLRKRLSDSEWALLHAPTSYLKTLIAHCNY